MAELHDWHGDHEVPVDKMISLTVGRLALSIARRFGEWRIGWHRDDRSRSAPQFHVGAPKEIVNPEVEFTVERFLTQSTGNIIRLSPLLADRPIVSRPEDPLRVPAGDEACIFVSSPLWVRTELLNPSRVLLEQPSSRPSDTWFGPNTRHGMVAYASQTAARLAFDRLPPMGHRAITKVTVRNQARSILSLDRLSVPAPNLQLFIDKTGGFWTTPLLVVHENENAAAQVEVIPNPPDEADDATLVAEPREAAERTVLSRAIQVLAR